MDTHTVESHVVYAHGLSVRAAGRDILRLPQWQVPRGEHALILGPSGCGKTTLLHALAGLVPLASGELSVANTQPHQLSEQARDRWRGRVCGLVFQRLHLVSPLTVLQNVLLAPHFAGLKGGRERALHLLSRLELADRAHALPADLSLGEAQRVAIARALMNDPQLILADEPTASLDDRNAERVAALLLEEASHAQATLIVATHDARLRRFFPSPLRLQEAV